MTSAIYTGKAPLARRRQELPKPTESLQARKAPLDLEKNVGKTLMVDSSTDSGRKGPGYYCELCRRTCKDSIGYLDHINGRSREFKASCDVHAQSHQAEQRSAIVRLTSPSSSPAKNIRATADLRRLGQTTQVQRSTVEQVRARLATLLEEKRRKDEQRGLMGGTLEYDFQARVKQIAEKEEAARQERKRRKQEERDRRAAAATAKANAARAGGGGGDVGGSAADEEMMKMMGFGGFGSSKK